MKASWDEGLGVYPEGLSCWVRWNGCWVEVFRLLKGLGWGRDSKMLRLWGVGWS